MFTQLVLPYQEAEELPELEEPTYPGGWHLPLSLGDTHPAQSITLKSPVPAAQMGLGVPSCGLCRMSLQLSPCPSCPFCLLRALQESSQV